MCGFRSSPALKPSSTAPSEGGTGASCPSRIDPGWGRLRPEMRSSSKGSRRVRRTSSTSSGSRTAAWSGQREFRNLGGSPEIRRGRWNGAMVLEALGQSLRNAIRRIAGASHVDPALIKEVVRDIQRALIGGDVDVHLALRLSKEVERRALAETPPAGTSPREDVIRIIYEEIVKILGKAKEIPAKPQRILMVGLYGQGKTTTIGKLANFLPKRGLSVGLGAGGVHRPAA